MKTFSDIQTDGTTRILLWGPPGAGKTSLASTWPGVVFADCDNNLHVLKSADYANRFGTPNLIGYENFHDVIDPTTGIVSKATGLNNLIDFINDVSENPDVKTIVIDSLTAVQVLAMNLGIELTGATRQSKAKERLKKHKILVPTQADYGAEMSAFSQLMNQLSAIPKNVICIAHEREDFNDAGQVLSRSPSLIGSAIRSTVGKWFQEVWYLGPSKGNDNTRTLQTQSSHRILGLKSAAFSLPPEMVDPSYDQIKEHIMNQ